MVYVFYGLSVMTGLIYLLDIQEASAMTDFRGEAFVNLWQVATLTAGLLGLWGVMLATTRRRDPRDGFKIELVGALWVAITQVLYLDSLIQSGGVGFVAQTQLYSFMFALAAAARAVQLPFEIIRATRLMDEHRDSCR